MSASRTLWYHPFGAAGARLADDPLARALARAGLSPAPLDGDGPDGAGVVVFDGVSDELCGFIREASAGGERRVVAVAATREALAGGGAWRLLRAGASDVLPRERPGGDVAAEVAARLERWEAVDRLVDSPLVRNHLLGRSPVWRSLLRQVVEVAAFTDAPVLVTGESGTGKELVARLIHTLDRRPNKRELVVLDCTTVVRELSGSEFFGHERGAFTGAERARDGAFAMADGGTLFLDEVGELPPPLQAQLLRVVQERTYKRVGGNAWMRTDFRLVCATHRDLPAEVEAGAFRADLYWRMAAVTCRMPPLRDRPEDVLPLFAHFVAAARGDGDEPELDEPVRELLLARDYPGNVRDLKQLAARVAYRHVVPAPSPWATSLRTSARRPGARAPPGPTTTSRPPSAAPSPAASASRRSGGWRRKRRSGWPSRKRRGTSSAPPASSASPTAPCRCARPPAGRTATAAGRGCGRGRYEVRSTRYGSALVLASPLDPSGQGMPRPGRLRPLQR